MEMDSSFSKGWRSEGMESGCVVVSLWKIEGRDRVYTTRKELITEIRRLRELNYIRREILAAFRAGKVKLLSLTTFPNFFYDGFYF